MFRQKRKFHYQHQKFTIAFNGCVPIQELWFGITDKEMWRAVAFWTEMNYLLDRIIFQTANGLL